MYHILRSLISRQKFSIPQMHGWQEESSPAFGTNRQQVMPGGVKRSARVQQDRNRGLPRFLRVPPRTERPKPHIPPPLVYHPPTQERFMILILWAAKKGSPSFSKIQFRWTVCLTSPLVACSALATTAVPLLVPFKVPSGLGFRV